MSQLTRHKVAHHPPASSHHGPRLLLVVFLLLACAEGLAHEGNGVGVGLGDYEVVDIEELRDARDRDIGVQRPVLPLYIREVIGHHLPGLPRQPRSRYSAAITCQWLHGKNKKKLC